PFPSPGWPNAAAASTRPTGAFIVIVNKSDPITRLPISIGNGATAGPRHGITFSIDRFCLEKNGWDLTWPTSVNARRRKKRVRPGRRVLRVLIRQRQLGRQLQSSHRRLRLNLLRPLLRDLHQPLLRRIRLRPPRRANRRLTPPRVIIGIFPRRAASHRTRAIPTCPPTVFFMRNT